MPTYQRCDKSVNEMANALLFEFDTHKPLINAKTTIDFVFAFSDKDEKTGKPVNDALSKNGYKAIGLTRAMPLKDRALGRADSEVALDGDWWKEATVEQQRALLDHELHHLEVKIDNRGIVKDDLGRAVIRLRKHDYDFGWFNVIAKRHGDSSMERNQAWIIMHDNGQLYWPSLVK